MIHDFAAKLDRVLSGIIKLEVMIEDAADAKKAVTDEVLARMPSEDVWLVMELKARVRALAPWRYAKPSATESDQ